MYSNKALYEDNDEIIRVRRTPLRVLGRHCFQTFCFMQGTYVFRLEIRLK